MNSSLIYFITSLLIIVAAIIRVNRNFIVRNSLFLAATILYSIFCFLAFGRMSGLIPTVSIAEIAAQKGFDAGNLPTSIDILLSLGFGVASLFNVISALCVWFRVKPWKWVVGCIIGFCCVSMAGGLLLSHSPILSIFEGCCAFMAIGGWILGLSYIEICVIGNIWLQCATIMLSAGWLIYRSSLRLSLIRIFAISVGVVQILLSILILLHYAGSMDTAFYRCVHDLREIAAITGTSYVDVNIFIYVISWPLLIAADCVAAYLFKPNQNPVNSTKVEAKSELSSPEGI